MLFIRGTGADRLSGRRRGGEHAAAGRAHQTRHPRAALHRRRPPVGHVGLALDPQRLARGGGGRRPRASSRPATGCASTSTSGEANILISDEELAQRRADLQAAWRLSTFPKSQTPWQEIQRGMVDQFAEGMVLKPAVKYRHVAQRDGHPARQPLEPALGRDAAALTQDKAAGRPAAFAVSGWPAGRRVSWARSTRGGTGHTRCPRNRRWISASPGMPSTPGTAAAGRSPAS